MSAGQNGGHSLVVVSSLDGLAPQMRYAVQEVLHDIPNAKVYESIRSNELQAIYWARGRTVIPPDKTVTNVENAEYGWHLYGLAVDIIHTTLEWDAPDSWFQWLGSIGKSYGLDWGGDWHSKDLPHLQWGKCKPTPSDEARRLLHEGGVEAVWDAVGAR